VTFYEFIKVEGVEIEEDKRRQTMAMKRDWNENQGFSYFT
jgi:hypothetical protein